MENDDSNSSSASAEGPGRAPQVVPPMPFLEPSPESFLPTPKPPLSGFERPPQPGSWRSPLLFALAMVAVSVAHWGATSGNGYSVSPKHLMVKEEWWRFVSALFAHGDFDHLAHNLPPFMLFAWLLRGYFGAMAFPWLGLLAGVGANIVTVFTYGAANDSPTALLGASGMVYGLVGVWLVLYMAFDQKRSFNQRCLRAIGFGLALFFPKNFEPRVSYMAHLSGFVIGALLAYLLIPWFRRFSPMLVAPQVPNGVQLPGSTHKNLATCTDLNLTKERANDPRRTQSPDDRAH